QLADIVLGEHRRGHVNAQAAARLDLADDAADEDEYAGAGAALAAADARGETIVAQVGTERDAFDEYTTAGGQVDEVGSFGKLRDETFEFLVVVGHDIALCDDRLGRALILELERVGGTDSGDQCCDDDERTNHALSH